MHCLCTPRCGPPSAGQLEIPQISSSSPVGELASWPWLLIISRHLQLFRIRLSILVCQWYIVHRGILVELMLLTLCEDFDVPPTHNYQAEVVINGC